MISIEDIASSGPHKLFLLQQLLIHQMIMNIGWNNKGMSPQSEFGSNLSQQVDRTVDRSLL
jgi:hypothetical protein